MASSAVSNSAGPGGWNCGAFHQRSVNGTVRAFQAKIQVLSSGSPGSLGTRERGERMSGQVSAAVSST